MTNDREPNTKAKNHKTTEREMRFMTGADIKTAVSEHIDWVVKPWVARGAISELVGKLKAGGKTTLLLDMAAAAIGGRPFMGEPTIKTPVVYLTEQSTETFTLALKEAGLLGSRDIHVLTWKETIGVSWSRVVRAARAKCREVGAKMLIIDTLSQFVGMQGDDENSARDALKAMRPIQKAAHKQRLAIVVSRHERKGGGEVGDSGRGSTAFSGAVDVILSIRRLEGKSRSTLREIRSLSRFKDTPDRLVIELTKHGYVSHGSGSAFAAREARAAILAVAPRDKKHAMPRETLLVKAGVKSTTGRRALEKLMSKGRLLQLGKGRKNDPYRYCSNGQTS